MSFRVEVVFINMCKSGEDCPKQMCSWTPVRCLWFSQDFQLFSSHARRLHFKYSINCNQAKVYIYKICMNKIIQADVAVIGCGPVGLTACLLLQKFGLKYKAFQRNDRLRAHPSAHWINIRSKQIFSEIAGLNSKIQAEQEDWRYFSHYRHMQRVLGRTLGKFNHFAPSVKQKLDSLKKYTRQQPNHVNQSKLVSLLYDTIEHKSNVNFSTNIDTIVKNGQEGVVLRGHSKGENVTIQCKYAIACDGFHSSLRNNLKIGLRGEQELLNCINIHFQSKKLANCIDRQNQNAMLHFIYNQKLVSILVNHTKKDGIFVLQVPNYEPFYDLLTDNTPQQLIRKSISQFQHRIDDLKIIQVGKWKVSCQIAERYKQQNIFLAGDAAHSFPPAGGFGMNTGIADIHNLIHKIRIKHLNKDSHILEDYSCERIDSGTKFMKLAKQGYDLSLRISKELGLNSEILRFANQLSFLPFRNKLFNLGVQTLYRPKPINDHIRLFYDQQFEYHKLSSYRYQLKPENLFIKDINCADTYKELYGIDQKYIQRRELKGQSLIRSDGIVLY